MLFNNKAAISEADVTVKSAMLKPSFSFDGTGPDFDETRAQVTLSCETVNLGTRFTFCSEPANILPITNFY